MTHPKENILHFVEKTMNVTDKFRRNTAVNLLNTIVTAWPSPKEKEKKKFNAEPGTLEYAKAYGKEQFVARMRRGLGSSLPIQELWGKRALEIGCGHGGITCFLGCMGATTTGIDLNTTNLELGRQFAEGLGQDIGRGPLPVEFLEMDASRLDFSDNTFDFILADNLLEHVMDPEAVLREARRVLKPDGVLVLPKFSSIYSKYGLHLKHGLKLPWANLLFSDQTIVKTLLRQAEKRPELFEVYPGLYDNPQTPRDVRRYKDLNDITYAAFRKMAQEVGFELDYFRVKPTLGGRILRKFAPLVEKTILLDILSTSAAAVLRPTPDNSPVSSS